MMPKQIIIVGRGHSGTRCIANTLEQSGLYMGRTNDSGDTIPGTHLYEAVKMAGDYVEFIGQYEWDFREIIEMNPPLKYVMLMEQYLAPHFLGKNDPLGWKLPESALAMPWLVKMFPDAHYIHWVRDGRDNALGYHDTENLDIWNIPHIVPQHSSRTYNAAVSWKYHEDIIEATPKPENWLKVRYEDFVLAQAETLEMIEDYLSMELVQIPVNPEPIGRWQDVDVITETVIMKSQLERHGYVEARSPIKHSTKR